MASPSPSTSPANSSSLLTEPGEDAATMSMRTFASFSGPLPPPEILQAFGEINPAYPDIIVARSEREQAHRHAIEHKLIDCEIESRRLTHKERKWTSAVGGVMFVAVTIVGGVVALWASPAAGATMVGAAVAAISSIIWSNKQNRTQPASNTSAPDSSVEGEPEGSDQLPQ